MYGSSILLFPCDGLVLPKLYIDERWSSPCVPVPRWAGFICVINIVWVLVAVSFASIFFDLSRLAGFVISLSLFKKVRLSPFMLFVEDVASVVSFFHCDLIRELLVLCLLSSWLRSASDSAVFSKMTWKLVREEEHLSPLSALFLKSPACVLRECALRGDLVWFLCLWVMSETEVPLVVDSMGRPLTSYSC